MKIAIFSDCYLDLTGGIVSIINAEKAELERLGHTVYVFTTAYPRTKRARTMLAREHIYPLPSCRFFLRGLTPVSRRPRVVEKYLAMHFPELKTFDVIFTQYEGGASIAGMRYARTHHIPVVQAMHGREDMGETHIIPFGLRSFVAFFLCRAHSWCLAHTVRIHRDHYLANNYARAQMWTLMVNHANYADAVVVPSEHFRIKLQHYGVSRPIFVVPNGFPDAKFVEGLSAREVAGGRELRIIWHSRVSAEKRMMPFLHALREVHGHYRVDVYGGGGDHFRARRYAWRHHLNVYFHGNAKFDVIYNRLLHSDLDVLVSYNFDTFGMTLIEAESAGVPVFFCDPDMCEVVPAGSYCLAAGPTPSQMAATLQDLLDHPERIHEMSQIMLSHRHEVLMSHRIGKLLAVFKAVIDNSGQ